MGRDARPEILAWRQRPTAADLAPPEAVAAELQRVEAERRRQQASRRARKPESSSVECPLQTAPGYVSRQESEDERDEPTPGERQRARRGSSSSGRLRR
jgi:hypothetical protein